MIKCELEIRHNTDRLRPASAVLIPGANVARWLQVLALDVGPQKSIRVFTLGDQSSNVVGGLVYGFSKSLPSEALSLGTGYYSPHPRVFLPCLASPYPALSETDWDAMLGHEMLRLWSPTDQWIAFDQMDAHTLSELVQVSDTERTAADRAEPGLHFITRLNSISAASPPTVEDVLDSGRDDIGSQQGDIQTLPKSKAEDDLPKSSMGQQLSHLLGSSIIRITDQIPANANRRTWINALQDWAGRNIISHEMVEQRKRTQEISRLIEMLEKDPDAGLKFALPMGGDAGRGVGSPSNSLRRHSTDFSLRGLGGGAAQDCWEIAQQHQLELSNRYRELAHRECDLGRFRRGAYVYAHLLGDHATAAHVLETGQHFRESAALYRDRLDKPLEAASCLARGGLLSEALHEYKKLERWIEAGDIHERMGAPEMAIPFYRRHVEALKEKGAWIDAADVLVDKLGLPDEARVLLLEAWTANKEAVRYIEKVLSINKALNAHKSTRDWLESLTPGGIPNNAQSKVFRLMVDIATIYPDGDVRKICTGQSQKLASAWLERRESPTFKSILALYPRLFPGDRLLTRDCRRVAHKKKIPAAKATRSSAGATDVSQLTCIRAICLPEKNTPYAYARSENVVYGISTDAAIASCSRFSVDTWRLETQEDFAPYQFAEPAYGKLFLIEVLRNQEEDMIAYYPLATAASVCEIRLEATEDLPNASLSFSACVDSNVVGCCRVGSNRIAMARVLENEITVNTYDLGGHLLSSLGIRNSEFGKIEANPPVLPLPIVSSEGRFFIGMGKRLLVLQADGQTDTRDFEKAIVQLAISNPGTRLRLAIGFENRVGVLWDNINFGHCEYWNFGRDNPKLTFTRVGQLVVGGEDGYVFTTQDGKLELVHTFDIPSGEVARILPGNLASEFVVAEPNGAVSLFDAAKL